MLFGFERSGQLSLWLRGVWQLLSISVDSGGAARQAPWTAGLLSGQMASVRNTSTISVTIQYPVPCLQWNIQEIYLRVYIFHACYVFQSWRRIGVLGDKLLGTLQYTRRVLLLNPDKKWMARVRKIVWHKKNTKKTCQTNPVTTRAVSKICFSNKNSKGPWSGLKSTYAIVLL